MPSAASFLALASVAVAQSTTTLTLLAPLVGPESLVGSIVSVGPTATVYAVECPSGTSDDADAEETYCAFPNQRWTMTQGPETWDMEASATAPPGANTEDVYSSIYQSIGCHFEEGADEGTCSGIIGIEDQTSTMTEEVEEFTDLLIPVVITAGVEKLADTQATTTTENSTGSEATASASDSASTQASETTTASTTAATTPAGDDDNGNAAGTVTHNVFLVGMAAVIGGFALL